MKTIFEDTFDYTGKPDPIKWGYNTGGHGWGNNEKQYYTDSITNSVVEDGKLKIIARKEDFKECMYTSARLLTHGKFSFMYGRVDVLAKLPKGKGSWPAIWMLPDSIRNGVAWPKCGEIDIVEHVGKDQDTCHFTIHSETYNHTKGTQRTHVQHFNNVSEEFHLYSIDWTKDYITYLFDDHEIARFYKHGEGLDNTENGWAFNQPFFLLLNVAVGGYWPGEVDESTLPYTMEVAYVRVSQ
jgi:beta-glucanase (GH16 family)